MLQKDLMLPYRTILDNVALPLVIRGMKKKDARRKTATYFEEFGLQGTEHKYPSQLSGGMKQRAALLRTYLFSEKVALLDEPFSALDPAAFRELFNLLIKVKQQYSLTVIIVLHDINRALNYGDRIIGIKNGKISFDLPSHQATDHIQVLYNLPDSAIICNTEKKFFF